MNNQEEDDSNQVIDLRVATKKRESEPVIIVSGDKPKALGLTISANHHYTHLKSISHSQSLSSAYTSRRSRRRRQQQFELAGEEVDVSSDLAAARAQARRNRTMFSEWQLNELEWRFERNKYLITSDRLRVSKLLNLDQLQVKTWFQVSS